jgi:sirohydrochlorin cobaltochelatase
MAKTSHYWVEHMTPAQHQAISSLFLKLSGKSPLIQPPHIGNEFDASADAALFEKMAKNCCEQLELQAPDRRYAGWSGVNLPSVRFAIWIMRALVVCNIPAGREETTLSIPVSPQKDADGEIVLRGLARLYRLALSKGMF